MRPKNEVGESVGGTDKRQRLRLEGGEDDPEDRKEIDEADDRRDKRAAPARLADAAGAAKADPLPERNCCLPWLRLPWSRRLAR